ncbi:PR domain zinc finger protein 14 [Elysia marginata]|uniref:PR domain zinc finger protein 14 n=1 Tax=Elysia marginata TaxID=1093978 RepID=A0AAV4IA33_9GAST|nr:PR domain zinc finger protein 14 [Elysia marginata]
MEEASESDGPPRFSMEEINTVELPPCIDIRESLIHRGEAGAFAKVFIRKDTRFGPYKGEIINPGQKDFIDYRYAWEIHEKRSRALKYTISALDPKASNWMRHVNNARFYEEQNILSVQDGFSIFYVVMKNIDEGQELLTWFDPKLLKRTQRRQARTERRPIGYTIELVPWSDEKKFTPEIIDTKRARKKKVLSDMIALDEDPKAMTRTLQSLPKIPCTPRQLGNMAYPLANTLKRRKTDHRTKPRVRQSNFDVKVQADQHTLQDKPTLLASHDRPVKLSKLSPQTETKPAEPETKLKLESLPPHENLKEALQAAEDGPKLVPHVPLAEVKTPNIPSGFPSKSEGQGNVKKKRGRKRLSDLPRGRPRIHSPGPTSIEYRPGMIKPVCLKTQSDGSVLVEDHDESYTLREVKLGLDCDDRCPCLDKPKCMRAKDPPSAANNYAMFFTLLPEHKIVKNGKIAYKCDVCDGTYNHAFSLKRHYLSVHINHRYLTRDDIINCQIETFHTGIQINESKPPPMPTMTPQNIGHMPPQNTGPMPTLMAVNVTNFLASLSPPKSIQEMSERNHLDDLDSKLRCDEELDEGKEISKENVTKKKAKKRSVPTLATLAQACLNCVRQGNFVNDASKLKAQILPKCKETINFDVMEPTKDESQIKKNHILGDEKPTDSTKDMAPVSTECFGHNETLNLNSQKNEKLINNETLKPFENNRDACPESLTKAPVCSGDFSYGTPRDGGKSLHLNSISNNGDSEPKNEEQERKNKALLKPKQPDSTVSSSADCEKANAEPLSGTHCLEKGTCDQNQEETTNFNDETDSSVAFASHSETSIGKTAGVPSPNSCDHTKNIPTKTADEDTISLRCGESSVDSTQEKTNQMTQELSTSLAIEGNSVLNSISSIPQSSSCTLSESSSTAVRPSSSVNTEQHGISSSSQAARNNAQPPVIFLTNIVFPVPGTLGQPILPQQRPLAPTTPQTGTATLSSPTTLTSQSQISLIPSVGSNVRLSGPRAPVPLVLISQVPPGVDPRNAASTFLNTSTGIKTLQDLQKSLTVAAAMGNTNTQLTSSSLPCLIGPLGHGASALPGTPVTSMTSAPGTRPPTLSTGLTTLPPGTSLPVPTKLPGVSTACGSLPDTLASSSDTVSTIKTVTSQSSSISTLSVPPTILSSHATITTPLSTVIPNSSSIVTSARPSGQPEDLFRCHMCVLVFQTMQQLKHHIRNDPHRFKGGIKQYACLQCSMRFSNKSNLARHNLMNHAETEEYKFRCCTCGKGFSSETYLKMHARFHLGKSFPCKYGCKDVYFPNAATLVKHLRTEHAGLDLKEYKRTHRMRPYRRKKISQMLEAAPSPSVSIPANQMPQSTLSQQEIRNTPDGIISRPPLPGRIIGLSAPALPESQQTSPYSLLQPGVGFQAKRGRPKGSKNTVKNGKPIIPSPVNSPSLPPPPPPPPLKVEIPEATAAREPTAARNLDPTKRQRRVARFVCKLCQRKFTTHLKLLRHRTRKHGMDQSVQEYLHFMSKNRDGYASDPDQTVYSPPASPKTFFSNVCQRGYENFTQFIDGGPESLKSPIKKYINIKGFSSISAPFDDSQEQKLEVEWTMFNFPPSFKYNFDSTTFYDTESGENFKSLTDKTLAQVKTKIQNENDRDSTPEVEYAQKENVKFLDENPLVFPVKSEDTKVKEGHCLETSLTTLPVDDKKDVADENPSLENLPSHDFVSSSKDGTSSKDLRKDFEDPLCDIGSKERCKQVIESLARHLACEKLPTGESDLSESLSQEDEGVEGEVDEAACNLHIKTESLDDDTVKEADKEMVVENELKGSFDISATPSEAALADGSEIHPKDLGTVENSCFVNGQSGKSKHYTIETPDLLQEDVPSSGTDSGLSSMSSCTLESPDAIQSHNNGNISGISDIFTATNTSIGIKQFSQCTTQIRDVTANMKDAKFLANNDSKIQSKLPFFSVSDKSKLMRRLTIQGIITDDSFNVADSKLSASPTQASRSDLNALDLCVPGGQLSSDRLAQIMKSVPLKPEIDSIVGSKVVRHRSISLPSFKEGHFNLNSSDTGKHHEHKRLSLWAGHLPQKALDHGGQEAYNYCPIVNTIQKQQIMRELENYKKAKAKRDKGIDRNHFPGNKLSFAESMGLMSQADFEMYPKQVEVPVIKPPEVWANYENIWFGKRGTIVVVCSICHRHFSCWDLCLRHQLKKHPHIEPNFLQMEKGNYVDDMYYYYPMKYGILAQTEPIPRNLPLPELYVCTRCGFPFRNLNRLHAHIIACDPYLVGGSGYKLSQNKKKLLPMMDRRLSQQNVPADPVKPKLGRPFKRPPIQPTSYISSSGSNEKLANSQNSPADSPKPPEKMHSPGSVYDKPMGSSPPFSFYHGRKRKNYELLYNPQNHMRRREMYQVLDTHQCHGCNLKFKSMSMLERHVKKCSGRDRLQNQKPLLSGIMPDDATVRKQHTCRYCNKRFTYIKGVDLHYKRVCSVRKVREEEGKLTPEDLAHEEELHRIIEHLKWSKTLNKDSSDIIQGNVRVEEDGSLTRVVKKRGFPPGTRKRVKKRKVKNKKWTYMKNHRHANRSAAASAGNTGDISLRPQVEPSTHLLKLNEQKSNQVHGQFGFQKKRPSPKENSPLPSPPKKSALSDVGPSALVVSTEGSNTKHSEASGSSSGRRGRPRKYPIGDPRSRSPRVTRSNSAALTTTAEQKLPTASCALKSSSSEADTEMPAKPQARKRGRPKKFDPSDMESSYKKKKRTDFQDSDANKGDQKSNKDGLDTSSKLATEENMHRSMTRRQQRAKVPTAAVRDDFVYEELGANKKQTPGRGSKGRRTKAQNTKDTSVADEKPPFSELELMEKMKELKKAAQLESDRCKLRKEQRRIKAKSLHSTGNSDKSSKISDKTQCAPASNSTELFKHLMEDIPLSSKAKSSNPQKESPHQVTALPEKVPENISGENPQSIKSSSLKANESSMCMPGLERKKSKDSPKLLSAPKDLKGKATGALSPKSKVVDQRKNHQDKTENALQLANKEQLQKVSSLNPASLTASMQLPECSVKVMTLSPKDRNLINCQTLCKDTSQVLSKTISPPFPSQTNSKENSDAPLFSKVTGDDRTFDLNKEVTEENQDKGSPYRKMVLEKEEKQAMSPSEISTNLSLYSNGEELLKVADKTSISQSSSGDSDQSLVETQNVSHVKIDIEAATKTGHSLDDGAATKTGHSLDGGADTKTGHSLDGGAETHPQQKPTEEAKVQAFPQETVAKPTKRTKIVFVQAGKPPQILSSMKYDGPGDLGGSPTPQSMIQTSSSQTYTAVCKSSTEKPKTLASLVVSRDTGVKSQTTKRDVPFAGMEGSTVTAKKSIAAPIKLIRGSLDPQKTPSVAPITVFSSPRKMPVSSANTTVIATQRSTISGSVSTLTPPSTANLCSPMALLTAETSKVNTTRSIKQCEPVGTNQMTHVQIKGGLVTQKPRVVQTAAGARPVQIVSSLNPTPSEISASKGIISPKIIIRAGAHSSPLHSGASVQCNPAVTHTIVKTCAKVISPPARIVSHSATTAGSVRPRGTTPQSFARFPNTGMRPVQTSLQATSSTKLRPVKYAPTHGAATSSLPRGPVASENLPGKPQPQNHVIRTLIPSKSTLHSPAQQPLSVKASVLSTNRPTTASLINSNTAHATKHSYDVKTASVVASPSMSQHSLVESQSVSVTAGTIGSPAGQVCLEPEIVTSKLAAPEVALPAYNGATTLETQPIFIEPPSNPIMITLEDGSTAMLDAESLAQLLSPVVEENIPVAPESEPGLTTVTVPDPGSVMVNMAEIQPGQGVLQTGEVLWEGFPDL